MKLKRSFEGGRGSEQIMQFLKGNCKDYGLDSEQYRKPVEVSE